MGAYDHKQVVLDYANGNITAEMAVRHSLVCNTLANCMKPKRLLISADMNCEASLTVLKL